jgi:O-acetyl-ADP-ribose deacetylase (regulator of RNase III)
MVKMVLGDLFKSGADILAHGTNCKNGFGSGVAGAMAELHPRVKAAYHAKFFKEGWTLGEVQFVFSGSQTIANCATQYEYYPRNKRHVDYVALRACMEKVKLFAQTGDWTVAMPKIGAGLAGGDWDTIKQILDEVFTDYDVEVYYLE